VGFGFESYNSWGMSVVDKSRCAAAFRFECIDREDCRIETTRMVNVETTSPDRPILFEIDQIEPQGCMNSESRMQTTGRLPRPVANPPNHFSFPAGRL